jgi:hypothetical protein
MRRLARARATGYAILHHVLLALTIASVTVLAEKLPYFLPVDVVTRGAISFVQALWDQDTRDETIKRGFRVEWDPVAAEDRPRVIVVPRFAQQAEGVGLHPIDFAADLIHAVARQEPAVLAIDLDLDPFVDDPRLNDPACDFLLVSGAPPGSGPAPAQCGSSSGLRTLRIALEARRGLKRTLEEAAGLTSLVVTAPPFPIDVRAVDAPRMQDPVATRILLRQLLWTQEMCRLSNVRVALPVGDLPNGLAFQHNRPTLGNLTWHVSRTVRPRGDIQMLPFVSDVPDGCSPFRPPDGVQRVASLEDARDLVRMMQTVVEPPRIATIGTISSRYYKTMSHGIHLDVNRLRPGQPVADLVPPGLAKQVVFLGDDQFVTRVLHFDQRPLVDFHAAVYYSNLHGARSLRHVFAFLLDVGLGTVLGVLFTRLWGWYSRARLAMDRTEVSSFREMVLKFPAYLRARGVLLVNLAVQAALVVGMFAVAYALLRVDVWINPLPLVLGMSIKGLLASRQLHVGHEPEDWWTFYNRHRDVPLQALAVVLSLGFSWYLGH